MVQSFYCTQINSQYERIKLFIFNKVSIIYYSSFTPAQMLFKCSKKSQKINIGCHYSVTVIVDFKQNNNNQFI